MPNQTFLVVGSFESEIDYCQEKDYQKCSMACCLEDFVCLFFGGVLENNSFK